MTEQPKKEVHTDASAPEKEYTAADIPLDKDDLKTLERLAASLERSKVNAYIDMLEKPRHWFWTNFFGGVARGVGMAIGFTVLGALVFFIAQTIVDWNLPGISDLLRDLTELVELYQTNQLQIK